MGGSPQENNSKRNKMIPGSKVNGQEWHRLPTWSIEWCYANRQKIITNRKRRNKEVFQYRMEPASKRSSGVKSSQEAFRAQRDKQTSLGGRHCRAGTSLDGPHTTCGLAWVLRPLLILRIKHLASYFTSFNFKFRW